MAKLICISGMSKGEEYQLKDDLETTVGRSESNDICVLDKKASRAHCKIALVDNQLTLVDLNSTNGVRVNNELVIKEMSLSSGDHIRIGQTVYLVSIRGTEADHKKDDISNSQKIRKQKKYNNLLHQTGFQMTQTSNLKKLPKEDSEKETGFLAFFKKNKDKKN